MSARILVADDSAFWREELKLILEDDSDSVVFEARDSFEALQKANWIHPHLAILDLSMPSLDGLGTARELKHRAPNLPIVILTVDKNNFLEVLARQSGILAVFSKMECPRLKTFVRGILQTRPS